VRRAYDAEQSRLGLLEAAQELFSEHGFERTTTRRIADLAGVDAALIARYFGGKEGLYLAAVAADGAPAIADHLDSPRSVAVWLFDRTRGSGPGPVMQALVRSDTAPDIRAAAADRLDRLMIGPLAAALSARSVPQPRLRAEIVVFSLVGLVVGRAQPGSDLATTDQAELVDLVEASLTAIMASPSAPVPVRLSGGAPAAPQPASAAPASAAPASAAPASAAPARVRGG
jgi:AcrR family transcriptional regulator